MQKDLQKEQKKSRKTLVEFKLMWGIEWLTSFKPHVVYVCIFFSCSIHKIDNLIIKASNFLEYFYK